MLHEVSMDLWQVEHDLRHELNELADSISEVVLIDLLLIDELVQVTLEVLIDFAHVLIEDLG